MFALEVDTRRTLTSPRRVTSTVPASRVSSPSSSLPARVHLRCSEIPAVCSGTQFDSRTCSGTSRSSLSAGMENQSGVSGPTTTHLTCLMMLSRPSARLDLATLHPSAFPINPQLTHR